jgi:hypothetical protein
MGQCNNKFFPKRNRHTTTTTTNNNNNNNSISNKSIHIYGYGRETWSLTLREEHRLRVFENRVLRRIFRSKREGAGVHNEELHNLYS